MRRVLSLLLVAAGAVGGTANAQSDYTCTVERVASADAAPSNMNLLEREVGKVFSVERRTGLMAGALKNAFRTTPQVIDMGSNQNAYKVLNSMRVEQGAGYGSNAYMLVVHEFVQGPKKPFLFADNGDVYFGSCVHF